jgi:transcription elongation factor Elf1
VEVETMKKIIITCPKCEKNIFVDYIGSVGNAITSICCKKCGNKFEIQNLINDLDINLSENFINKFWFYKYDNGDVRIGVSKQNINIVVFIICLSLIAIPYYSIKHQLSIIDIFNNPNSLLLIPLAGSFLSIIVFLYIFGTFLFGKFEFYISSKGSYSFDGFFNIGWKRRFLWNDIGNVFCEKSFLFGSRICLSRKGKSPIFLNIYDGSKEDIKIPITSVLNYLCKTKHNMNE